MTDPHLFKAVIFDLDGVITRTALVHSRAWKKMFDEFLQSHATQSGIAFAEFTPADYLKFVDGKPRYDGVKSFLDSRGIQLPFGDVNDPGDKLTVCGLGNRKNDAFNQVLKAEGVSAYEGSVQLLHDLRDAGIHIGVASSSKNCEQVLKAAGLLELFETRVDGVVSAEMGLKGKPAPDIFITAAKNLGVQPKDAIVVEDAESGVAAGKAGNFGLVLGLAREENESQLYASGADLVVNDLSEFGIDEMDEWFESGKEEDGWSITYRNYDPSKERTREALLTVGNGYFGTRGSMEEPTPAPSTYPATYIAGLYNRLITRIADKDIENEDFVNAVNWLPITFRIAEGPWFDPTQWEIINFERSLDFRSGLLIRRMEVRDALGNETLVVSQRFASMHHRHLGAMRYTIIPLNYSSTITLRTGIDGHLINAGVERYKSLNQNHLKPLEQGSRDDVQFVMCQTTQSGIRVATACTYRFEENYQDLDFDFVPTTDEARSFGDCTLMMNEGDVFSLDKIVAIYTSKNDDSSDPMQDALIAVDNSGSFDDLLMQSSIAWKSIWDKIDIQVSPNRFSQKLLRLHLYHLMVSMSPNNRNIDAGITARGLHGEAYRGHIFWDELFILPLYDINLPDVSRSMLMYRYRRLGKARAYAREYGYKGAMFPWQSGSDGREETQIIHLNPLNGAWDPDHSCLQRHVSLAVAFNVWQYFHITSDKAFMLDFGMEMFLETCRFWASKCHWNPTHQRYDLTKVMGPDEFHEQYPDAKEGGLNNNAYTNLMVAWAFGKVDEMAQGLEIDPQALLTRYGLGQEELAQWRDIASKLFLDINPEGIIAQYEGYFDLKELDWEHYRTKYGNIYRMDRILKSEGLSPDEYKVAKQADMLMVFYNLPKTEVDSLLLHLGYQLPSDYLQRNLEYYFRRTSHGSTLSRIVHAKLASIAGMPDMSWELYADALASDYVDIQGGTTAEGIHAGVMAGTILIALNTFAGLDLDGEMPAFSPKMPACWEEMAFGFDFKNVRYSCQFSAGQLAIQANQPSQICWDGKPIQLEANVVMKLNY